LSLSNKQKNWILKKRNKLSVKKIATELNVDKNEVQLFIDSVKNIPAKKSFYIIMGLIPILFFLLLEIFLRIFNYGYDTGTWSNVSERHLGLNPDVPRRYFYSVKNVPNSIQDVFLEEKMPNTFRVFVLGGSSAAGYPFMPFGSFSRYIRQRLEIVYPETRIEVVNLALTAVNSYTIRDFIPDVLEKEPDLILIYAGHNEYYGALGVGSMESLGQSRFFANLILSLNKYKTINLLRDIIQLVLKSFADDDSKESSGTLMSRMAQEKNIAFNSDIFNAGVSQFEGNMRDVVEMITEEKIPFIISTLACNLKDQKPFISKESDGYPPANEIYSLASQELTKQNIKKADSLFRFAKDLDMLRFRAPEKINGAIKSLSKEYSLPFVNADSVFAEMSSMKITGDNLMTDHLHPTLKGYQQLGRIFYERMSSLNYLPNSKPQFTDLRIQDSITISQYHFTVLDSTISNFKLQLLKNDFPFIPESKRRPAYELIKQNNFIDSVAYKFVASLIDWEPAQRMVAAWYLLNKDYKNFVKQMNALIHQFPIIEDYYNFSANELISVKRYDEAYDFLLGKYKLRADAYSSKWLGIIDLSYNKTDSAIKYLEESLVFDSKDFQVLYNLAGAYSRKNNFGKALELVNRSLELNPNYSSARELQKQLIAVQK
jgi:tetratricopeptide (TPR) repeat protein